MKEISDATSKLQLEMWSIVRQHAAEQPTPTNALLVAGMNDVLNTQGYTQAAWWNRIPAAAWLLMLVIAACAATLAGVGVRVGGRFPRLLLVLPALISVAFFMIADIDSPRRGIIRVVPMNLHALEQGLKASI